jgi:hypothetical protein
MRERRMRQNAEDLQEQNGFDVTCTIGRVEFHELGQHTPMECAMLLIAQHGASGTFHFPGVDGGDVAVTVEFS